MLFPRAVIRNLTRHSSDHAPILLVTDGAMSTSPKPFRFEYCWTRDDSSRVVVSKAWWSQVKGSAAFRLVQKIKKTKEALRKWNREHFGLIKIQIELLN